MNELDAFIITTIKKAGQEAISFFRKSDLHFFEKDSVSNLVSQADWASEEIIINAIKKRFSGQKIISEETFSEEVFEDEWTWVIDPLDGTRNFSRGTPFWGVIIGLIKNKQMYAGAMYFPALDELYYYNSNEGATFKNEGGKIDLQKARIPSFSHSMGCLSIDSKKHKELDLLHKMSQSIPDSNIWITSVNCGSYAAAMLLDGQRDWLFTSFGGNIWDYAVPMFLLQKAGFCVTDLSNNTWNIKSDAYIAAPSSIHEAILNIIS